MRTQAPIRALILVWIVIALGLPGAAVAQRALPSTPGGAASASAQQAPEFFNGREAEGNEIIIRGRTNDPADLLPVRGALSADESLEVLNQRLGLYVVRSPRRRAGTLLSALAGRAEIAYAEPNYRVHIDATPNDPSFDQLWGMQKIGAPQAWTYATGGRSAVAAIVDTGISYAHPDLAPNIWSAPAAFVITVNGQQISCPAGSHGFNAITRSCDPLDDNGHGTHVAGTLGATGNNGIGVAGVNWTASVMALKFLDSTGDGLISNAIRAVEFAIQVKRHFAGTSTPVNVRILSNSWAGGGFSHALLDEINAAGADDILFVAAAGNSSSNDDLVKTYPASYATANEIAVAATDSDDSLAGFSNFGTATVHLGAPGVGTLSTYLGNGYASLSGTSMATPHVAGAALLVLGACPSLDTATLKSTLLANVDVVPSLSGTTVSGGRLNVSRAINSCAGFPLPTLNGLTVSPGVAQSGQNVVIAVTLTAPATADTAVSLASSNPAVIPVPPAITIPAGASTASVTVQPGIVASAEAFTLTALYLGVVQTATGTVNPAPAAAATFVAFDTITQGNWKGKYGSEGYSIAGDTALSPAYVTPAWSNALSYTWAASSTDTRALQRASGPDRVAATWYQAPSFTIDLNFTDSNTHRLAIYCIDWDSYGPRSQIIEILDGSNNVLDTRSVSSFVSGEYLVWNVAGHVKIRATAITTNAVIEGIFFDGSGSAPITSSATFVSMDTTTQGNWKGKYGSEGYGIAGDTTLSPAYVTPSFINALSYTWASSSTDTRALQRALGSNRVAATWFQTPSFTIDLTFTDSNTHRLAIYCLDWDSYGPRSQIIEILDGNNNVLDTRSVSSFASGAYLVWNVAGHVKVRATAVTTNAVIEGIFFDGSGSVPPPSSSATFVSMDTTTQGNWKGKYGSEGYGIAGDTTLSPAYVTPSFINALSYTWAASSTDTRALQRASGPDRVAATWFQAPSFTIDLNFTDSNTHRLAIYCLDWDSYGPRSQIIEILDGNNNVLDTRSVSSFASGEYLVWNVAGHIKIRATTVTTNAVVEGIFFQ